MLRGRKGYRVQQVEPWQRRQAPSLWTSGLRRWLVLLLVLAFSTSGLVHVPMGDHVGSEASLSHELASVSQDASGEPCCPEHTSEPHGTTCCMSSSCSPGVLLGSSAAVPALWDAESAEAQSDEVYHSHAPSPRFRPPKLSVNT